MTDHTLQFIEIGGFRIYYPNDPSDPIVSYLKEGKLHGLVGYNILSQYFSNEKLSIIDLGAHIGTFSVEPIKQKHRVLLIENNEKYKICLDQTFSDLDNVTIATLPDHNIDGLIDKHSLSHVHAIRYGLEGHNTTALKKSSQLISKYSPLLLIEINSPRLLDHKSSPNEIVSSLEEIGYYCFLYNGSNFLIKLDKTAQFPFCQMATIAMHKDQIINRLGSITFGSHISNEIIKSLIQENISNADTHECQKYLELI